MNSSTIHIRSAAIPDEAIVNAISQWDRTLANSVLYRNFLPVPLTYQ